MSQTLKLFWDFQPIIVRAVDNARLLGQILPKAVSLWGGHKNIFINTAIGM